MPEVSGGDDGRREASGDDEGRGDQADGDGERETSARERRPERTAMDSPDVGEAK